MPARALIALTAAALLLRASTLDVQSFWADEAATVGVVRHSLGGVLRAVWDGESTPPLYYLLAWAWAKVAGTGEAGLRSLSALAGAATVPVAAALAARVARAGGHDRVRVRRAATGAGVLAAVSPLMVWYGQEARAYALLMLLVAGSALALLRALEDPAPRRLATWAALAVAAIWTHHFALFAVAAQAGWLAWALRARAVPALGVLAVAAGGLLPVLLHQRAAGRASFIARQGLDRRLAQIPKQVLTGYDGPAETLLAVAGVIAVLVALAGLAGALWDGARGPRPSPARVLAVVVLAGVLLPALAALAGQDFVLTRNVLGVLPVALALLGAGGALLCAPRAGTGALAVLTASGLVCAVAVAGHPAYQRDDFRSAIAAATGDGPAPRLVVADAEGRGPVALYLGAGTVVASPGDVRVVREIDVVRVAGAPPGGTRRTPVIPPGPAPAGFAAGPGEDGATWAVRRYLAPAAAAVDPAAVTALDPGHAAVVLARGR